MENRVFIDKLFLFVLMIIFTGCSDFLEKYPPDKMNTDNFWQTKEDAIYSINAAYDPLQSQGMYGRDAARWGAKTEELFRAGDFYNYDLYLPSSSQSNQGYFSAFQGILHANANLAYIPGMDISNELKERILGEAYFLRGFYYYFLARWYGGMPIILDIPTSTTDFNMPRETSDKVYEQVISDFSMAMEKLPEKKALPGEDLGRATKGAATVMLADLYLYLAAFNNMNTDYYEKVKTLCATIINSGQYDLESSFPELWDIQNENGIESIFEVQFAKGFSGEGHQIGEMVTSWNSTTVQDAFYDTWDATDQRRAVSVILPGEIFADYTNNSTFKHQKKLITGAVDAAGPGGGPGYDSPRNFIVQRYANVLLMYAEAANELSATPPMDAVGYVNKIRNRAGLPDLTSAATRDKSAFREAIRTERKYELAFEGFRWFDLVRYEQMGLGGGISDILMNPASPYYNSTIQLPKHYVFPIPQSELDANSNPLFVQNPGY